MDQKRDQTKSKETTGQEQQPDSTLRDLRGHFILPETVLSELERQSQIRWLGRRPVGKVFPLDENLILVTAGGGAELLDVGEGDLLWEIECPTRCSALSRDGRLLALGSGMQIYLWDLSRGELVHTFSSQEKKVLSVAFAPDGRTLASSWLDKTVQLWNVQTGISFPVFTGNEGHISKLTFAPDGQTLAGADEQWIRLWQVGDGTLLRTFIGHGDDTSCLAFAPDGQTLASGSVDSQVRLWQVSDGTLLRVFGHNDGVASLTFAPDGQAIAAGSWDNTVRIWRVRDGIPLSQINEGNAEMYYDYDGLETWRVHKDTSRYTLVGHRDSVVSVAFTPDGCVLVSGGADGAICLWRVEDGVRLDDGTIRPFRP